MTAKFTPGPWKSETIRYKDGDMFVRITTAYDVYDGDECLGPETICTIGGFPTVPLDGGKEWEATGRLMAAAPDMYDELKRARDVMQRLNTLNSLAFSLASIKESYISEISALLEQINGEESK